MKHVTKRLLSLLLTAAMLCGLCVPTAFASESRYGDIQGHWAEEAIERWSDYDIVQGYGGDFHPDEALTRGQMATILSNTLGLTKTVPNPFTDVKDDDWFASYVIRCYAAGIMVGSDGKARPESALTRQEAMVMLCRTLGIAPVEKPDLSAYADSDKVSDWAAPFIAAMVESGIVSGIGNNQLGATYSMTRAALMKIMDNAVVQYINEPGTYTLENKDGVILVAAGNVTLTGKTAADILVTPAADGKSLTFDKATVTGSITVQADNAKITSKNSKLPEITMTGEGSKVETVKPASSGGGGGSYTPSPAGPSDLTISEAKTVTGGTYKNVTITSAVGDGEVTLDGVTITGNLTVRGGGSNSIKLKSCAVTGRVILDKTITAQSTQPPRLELTSTSIAKIEAVKAAIIEAIDAASPITAVEAKANVEVKGAQTAVATVTVPAAAEAPVAVTVTAGTVDKVEAKSETTVNAVGTVTAVAAEAPVTVASGSVETVTVPATVTEPVTVTVSNSASVETVDAKGATTVSAEANALVGTVAAEAPVTVSSGTVNTITVPPTASESVAITVGSGATVAEVTVRSDKGTTITNNGTVSNVSAASETIKESVAATGTPEVVSHIHVWDGGIVTTPASCTTTGSKTFKCTVDGCTSATKVEAIPATGHNWSDWTENQGADTHTRVCQNDSQHTETADHAWDNGVVTKAATCAEKGVRTYTCSTCTATKTEEIGMLPHTEVVDAAKAPSCEETGLTEGKHCSVCSAVIVAQTTVDALGHDFTVAQYDNSQHWKKCSRCDATDTKADHSYDAHNCDVAAKCQNCEYVKPAGAHSYGAYTQTTEPTCTNNGVETATCTLCQHQITRDVDALGHSWGQWTAVQNADTHTRVCGRDNNHTETAAHAWGSGVVTKEATLTGNGIKTYTCSVCSGTKTEDIPRIATDEQMTIINNAASQNLLTYLTLSNLGGTTRLEMAKLVAAYMNLPVTPVPEAGFMFNDCTDADGLGDTDRGVVKAVVDAQIIMGTSSGTFDPDGTVTRAQIAELLHRMLNVPATGGTVPFTDVPRDHWAYPSIATLYNLGLISGTSPTTFEPNLIVSKEAALRLLLKAKGWTDPRTPVDVVTDFTFVKTNDALRAQITAPAGVSAISDFDFAFYDSTYQKWIHVGGCGAQGNGIPIYADLPTGTYTKVRVTSIPNDWTANLPADAEFTINLTITNTSGVAPASVEFTEVTDSNNNSGYSVTVKGLALATKQTVVVLAERKNGDGRRGNMSGDKFSDVSSSDKSVTITIYDQFDACLIPNGYYQVLEVLDANVGSNETTGATGTTAALKVNARGGWEKVNVGNLPAQSSISNIRFVQRSNGIVALEWDFTRGTDVGTSSVMFRVIAEGPNGEHVNCGTGRTEAHLTFPAGTYTSFTVKAVDMRNQNTVFATATESLTMNVASGATSNTASAAFTKDGTEYQTVISGLSGYLAYHIYVEVPDGNGIRRSGSFGPVENAGSAMGYLPAEDIEAAGAKYSIYGVKDYTLDVNGALSYTIDCLREPTAIPAMPATTYTFTIAMQKATNDGQYHPFVNGQSTNNVRKMQFKEKVHVSHAALPTDYTRNWGGNIYFANCVFEEDVQVTYHDAFSYSVEFENCEFRNGAKVVVVGPTNLIQPDDGEVAPQTEIRFWECGGAAVESTTAPVEVSGTGSFTLNGMNVTADEDTNASAAGNHYASVMYWPYAHETFYELVAEGRYSLTVSGAEATADTLRVSGNVNLSGFAPHSKQTIELHCWNDVSNINLGANKAVIEQPGVYNITTADNTLNNVTIAVTGVTVNGTQVNPACTISDIRFETKGNYWVLAWDSDMGSYPHYQIYYRNSETGEWEQEAGTDDTFLQVISGRWTAGVRVEAWIYDGVSCQDIMIGACENTALKIEPEWSQAAAAATVEFVADTAAASGYRVKIDGIPSGINYLFLHMEKGDNGDGLLIKHNGAATYEMEVPEWCKDVLPCDEYILNSYGSFALSDDDNTLSYTVTELAVSDCTPGELPDASSVSDIRFVMGDDGNVTLKWNFTRGTDIGSDEVRFEVVASNSSDSSIRWSRETREFAIPMTALAGNYDTVTVSALNINQGNSFITSDTESLTVDAIIGTTTATTTASATFTDLENDKATANLSGLGGYQAFQLYVVDADSNRTKISAGPVNSDGTATGTVNADVVKAANAKYSIYGVKAYTLNNGVLSYTIDCLREPTAPQLPGGGTDPVFGTPVLKTDGTFMWLELTVRNVQDPSKLQLWVQNIRVSNGTINNSYMNQSSLGSQWSFDGNTLKIYRVGYIMTSSSNLLYKIAVKDPDTGVMSAYSTNALVSGTDTREDVAITAVKASPASEGDYYTITCTRNDGSDFGPGNYYLHRPTTLDYTSMRYTDQAVSELVFLNRNSEILAATQATVKKVVPEVNGDGNIAVNLVSYNTFMFHDVAQAGISTEEGSGVVSAAKGVPVSLTLTIPDDVELKTDTPAISCRMYNTEISDVVVNGKTITFTASFNNLNSTQETVFYLDEADTGLGYPLCSQAISVSYVEMLNISAQAGINELYIDFGEGVTFYNQDGTAIVATDTATVARQVAEKLVLYKDGVDMGLTFHAGYTNGTTNFTFIYGGTGAVNEPAEYTFGLKDGVYFRSTAHPEKGYIGKPSVQYNGPMFHSASMDMTTGVLQFAIDAYDRTGETVPALDLTQSSFSVAPSGYWNREQYQVDLTGSYTRVDGTEPAEKGTYTIQKWEADNYNSGGYVYDRVFWTVNVMLSDGDLAALKAKLDAYNGTDAICFVQHEGFTTRSSSVEHAVNMGVSKKLTVESQLNGDLDFKTVNSYNGTHSGHIHGTGTLEVNVSFFAETIDLTYDGTTITVGYPAGGVLTVTNDMFKDSANE